MSRILKKKLVDEDVLTLARQRISKAFDYFDHICVSFSGGKDSTVCLNLTLEEARRRGRLPLDVVFWDEEAIHPETIDYVSRVSRIKDVSLRWYCLPVRHRNACSRRHPHWHPWAEEEKHLWCRSLPEQAITELAGFNREAIPECNHLLFSHLKDKTVGLILGIRADESMRRLQSVSMRGYNNWISSHPDAKNVMMLKPIYDWMTEDIWSAPRKFGWDYNRAYDTMQKMGITRNRQRVCPPFGEEPLAALGQYAVCWPELWEKMANRVPGAKTAARYSKSPLYSFGGSLAGWDPSADPRPQIARQLQRWGPEERAQISARISSFIRWHYEKTPDKQIPMEVQGPSGLTWKFLYVIATRGDLKGRRQIKFDTIKTADEATAAITEIEAADEPTDDEREFR